jgi:hypothetical protein
VAVNVYQSQGIPPDDEEETRIRRNRLFEAIMRGGTAAYNNEWDRLFPDPRPLRRIDAHDIGDVVILPYPIPEANADTGFYVLVSTHGDDAYLAIAGEDEKGNLMATGREIVIHRNALDWFQFTGVSVRRD